MSYRGFRGNTPRTLRTNSEDKGTNPAGFTGNLPISAVTGSPEGVVPDQPYFDVSNLALPAPTAAVRPITAADKTPFGVR